MKSFEFGQLCVKQLAYCRELSPDDALGVLDGGDADKTGLLLWETTVLFAQFIASHTELFREKTVLELGSGMTRFLSCSFIMPQCDYHL